MQQLNEYEGSFCGVNNVHFISIDFFFLHKQWNSNLLISQIHFLHPWQTLWRHYGFFLHQIQFHLINQDVLNTRQNTKYIIIFTTTVK